MSSPEPTKEELTKVERDLLGVVRSAIGRCPDLRLRFAAEVAFERMLTEGTVKLPVANLGTD